MSGNPIAEPNPREGDVEALYPEVVSVLGVEPVAQIETLSDQINMGAAILERPDLFLWVDAQHMDLDQETKAARRNLRPLMSHARKRGISIEALRKNSAIIAETVPAAI